MSRDLAPPEAASRLDAAGQALAALRASEEKYRLVVENANEGIVVSQDGMLKYANPRALELTDRTLEQAMSTPFIEMVHPDDRARVYGNYLRRLRGEPVEPFYVFRAVSARGVVRSLQISAVAVEWEGRPATLNFLTDVTEQVRAEEEVRRALSRERELSELKTRFVSVASHEFRTPLAAILSSVELLEDFGADMPEGERREVIRLVKGAVARMSAMIDQVMLIGRAESDRLEFRPEPMDPAALAASLAEEAVRAQRERCPVRFEARGDTGTRLLDGKLLAHILGNLLSNAIKYSPPGAEVRLALEATADSLALVVADRGIGIPFEDQPRLFESFHRARNVGNAEGTGLGLTIVRQCVELHGGAITFRSAPGEGSSFTVRLPAPPA